MGTYVTQATLESWLGTAQLVQLSSLSPSAGVVDESRVAIAIGDAEAELNAALGVLYSLPLSAPYPSLVVSLSRRLSRWHLWEMKAQEPPKSIQEERKRMDALLADIRSGKADLGLTTTGQAAAVADGPRAIIHREGEPRRLSRDALRRY